jgi:two-component system phosphate regulon sensor histidine kinase PhoR
MQQSINIRLVTRLTIFMVVIMAVGMAVMGLLLGITRQNGTLWVGMGIALLVVLPLGAWMARWVIRPILDIQQVAKQLTKHWDPALSTKEGLEEFGELGRLLTRLASKSQERIQALEDEQAKTATILNSMVEGVIALDPQGRVLLMNPGARDILDVGGSRIKGQFFLEVIRNQPLADLVVRCHTLPSGERCRGEVEVNLPVHRVLEANAMHLPLTGMTQGTLLVLHDVTELRRLEGVRSEFVANVSHELRTPLTAIKGYLETLLDEALEGSPTHHRFLEVAHTHAERLGRLVNDLLKLSDIETGKVTLRQEAVVLTDLINEVSAMFEKEAGKKEIIFRNEVATNCQAFADRDRLSQILLNVVDNAVKYTSNGGQVIFQSKMGNDDQVVLQVKDTGQGIPPGDLPRITERFYRVDKARTRQDGGTGLGLAIVKHLVQLHGGSLHIDSEFGRGTCIEISLPVPELAPSNL